MKIALKASNGLYVTAEEGGGIDTRNAATPIALRARGDTIDAWQQFDLVAVGAGFVALQTSDGYYLTAENGGGGSVRTNERAVGPWESFTATADGSFICWDREHYLAIAGTGEHDPIDEEVIVEARAVVPRFEIVELEPRPTPPQPIAPVGDQILDVQANFISMRDAQGRVMLSWFWPNLPPDDQQDWIARWRAAGLTHVVLCPIMQYGSQTALPSADWRGDPARFAASVSTLLGLGFLPIIQMTSGDGGSARDIDTYWPGLLTALAPVLPWTLLSCGFEVVGPGGGWTSAQLSRGLQTLHAAAPGAIGVHLQPERATGASHPIEPDDPWQGDEAGFWTAHGGEYADCLLYQTPHGSKLLDPNGAGPGVGAWEDRWIEILDRLGVGAKGWRKVTCILFEKTGYDYYRGQCTDADVTRTSQRGQALAEARGVAIGFGDGRP